MTFLSSWEEFSKAAERLYINDPAKTELVCKDPSAFARRLLDMPSSSGSLERCRFVTKYRHCDGKLEVKITDDSVCLQYRTEHAQDIKRLEKLTSQLMRHMASKEK